jgi:cell wall-associated NlpC family hydrolase
MAGAPHDRSSLSGAIPVTPHWSASFVGVPWAEKGRTRDGVDCWGLVRLVYAVQLGIELPSYTEAYASVGERGEIGALMSADSQRWPWTMLPRGRERGLDVAVFRRGGLAAHVGLIVSDSHMLHIEERRESCIVDYGNAPWKHRLVGLYRHADVR